MGAVMQCGRMEDADHATPSKPLLKAGIQMMTEIDRCRELNKMLKKSLFGSPDALKSFSGLRTMSPVPESLQNTIQAMFLLIGSNPKSVAQWNTTKKLCSPAGYNTLKKRIEEISPLLANMTTRVEMSLALTKGHENISSMPTGEGSLSFYACHAWVHGVMSACGVDDPRSHVGEGAAATSEDKVAEAAKVVGDENARAIAGAAEFGHGSDGDTSSSADSASSSDSEDDESTGASKAAGRGGGSGGGAKQAESSSSSSSGSESSDDEQDDASSKKSAVGTNGLPKPPPGMPTPPPGGPSGGAQPKPPPPRLKTTPANVVLPSADFVPEIKKSSDEDDSLSESSSDSDEE